MSTANNTNEQQVIRRKIIAEEKDTGLLMTVELGCKRCGEKGYVRYDSTVKKYEPCACLRVEKVGEVLNHAVVFQQAKQPRKSEKARHEKGRSRSVHRKPPGDAR